jgi:hypothetical protein
MFPIYLMDENFQEPEDSIYYLVSSSGYFLVKKYELFTSVIKVNDLPGLQPVSESLTRNMAKIPYEDILRPVIAFFSELTHTHRTEAEAYLYYSAEKKEYKIVIPDQQPRAANVPYKTNLKEHAETRVEGYLLVGDIHSHANMNAFHSGGDAHDEDTFEGIHITVGNLKSVPTISCSFVVNRKRFMLDVNEVIDFGSPYPADWMTKIRPEKQIADKIASLGDKIQEKVYGMLYDGKKGK